MSKGGYRPAAGRPEGRKNRAPRSDKGVKRGKQKGKEEVPGSPSSPLNPSDRDKLREILAIDLETREKAEKYSELLARASKGQSLSVKEKRAMVALRKDLEAKLNEGEENQAPPDPDAKVFLERLLIAQDSDVDQKTKIQIANILLPYQHPRKGEGAGKKDEQADKAAAAGKGKFAASAPPKLAVVVK